LKRFLRISATFLSIILLGLFVLWIIIQIPFVQQTAADYAAHRLSKRLGTKVQIGGFQLGLLNRFSLQDVLVQDLQDDTLLFAGGLKLAITDWFIVKDTIQISYIGLQDTHIRLQRTDSVWNNAFLLPFLSGGEQDTANVKPLLLQLDIVEVKNIRFERLDYWRGKKLIGGVKQLSLKATNTDFASNIFELDEIVLKEPEFREIKTYGKWNKTDSLAFWRRIDSLDRLPVSSPGPDEVLMRLLVKKVTIEDGNLQFYNRRKRTSIPGVFDERDIIINDINGRFDNLRLHGDTIKAKVKLSAKERSGFELKEVSTRFTMHPQIMEFADLTLITSNSKIGNYYAMRYDKFDDMEYFLDKVQIEAHLQDAKVSVDDIAVFAPDLKGIYQTGFLSGDGYGTVSDFVINNVDLRTGKSRITGTYTMRGLIDIEKSVINFSTDGSVIDLPDIAVWAPQLNALKATPVAQFGLLRFTGKFSGTAFDFAAGGNFVTDVGTIDAHLKMKWNEPGVGYTASVGKADLDGGKLLGVPKLGRMVFSGDVQSLGFDASHPVQISGLLNEITYDAYTYRDMHIESVFEKNMLKANMLINDPNLEGNITTTLNFSEKIQRYNARGYITHADFNKLGLLPDTLLFSGDVDVDFEGNTLDDFLGYARFYNATVNDGKQRLNFDSLTLESYAMDDSARLLTLQTNEASAKVEGRFHLSELTNNFTWFLHRYYPTIIKEPKGNLPEQDFTFEIVTRNIEPFLKVFDAKIGGLNYTTINGSINTRSGLLQLKADAPVFSYGSTILSNISLDGIGSASELRVNGSVENLQLNDRIQLPNAKLELITLKDSTHLLVTTNTSGPLGNAAVDVNIFTLPEGFEFRFNESSLIASNKKWTIQKDGNIGWKSGYVYTNGLQLTQDNQAVKISSRPDAEGNWNNLYATIESFNMGDWLPYFVTEPALEGKVNGTMVFSDPGGKQILDADLNVSQFYFNGDSVGVVDIKGQFDGRTEKLQAAIVSHNKAYDFDGLVNLDFSKDASLQLDTRVQLHNERINILRKYLTDVFDDLDGYANGELAIKGSFSAPAITGNIKVSNALLKVGYTQCSYIIDSATIQFGDNFIDFGTLNLIDKKGRTGIAEGRMYHRWFDSLSFAMRLRTNGMEVLNTKPKDNDVFYGSAVAKATFSINGPLKNLQMRITGVATDSSWIAIANKEGLTSGEAEYIVFKEYGSRVETKVDTSATNYHLALELTATPLCRVDVVLDQLTGDIISATGNGTLVIQAGTVEPTIMRGRYVVEKGSYNYTFQSLIRKPFLLSSDGNNFIEWNGDPYEANMNITATYIAKDVSLRDLMANENAGTILDQDARNYKGDVWVNAKLSGNLMKPSIDFEIQFPQGSVMRNNISALDMLRRISEDESENLRQVTYLIVFRSFAPYRQGAGQRNPGADLAVNTISELVSREMEKILTGLIQDLTRDQSLSVDLSTNFYNSSQTLGNVSAFSQYDRVNVNFNVNRSFYNNRVVVNLGSDFDMNVRSTAVTGFQFLPDINVEFILTPNRRLRAIIFKRDNLDIAGRRNRAGASISYRKDFNKLFGRRDEEPLLFMREGDAPSSEDSLQH
jgi:hypothetical protein